MRALVVGLSLALSYGVVSAQPAPSPASSSPSGSDASQGKDGKPVKKPAKKKAKPAAAAPDGQGGQAAPAAAPPPSDPTPIGALPVQPSLPGSPPVSSEPAAPAAPTKLPMKPGSPNKTDEKAGVNETLQKDTAQHPWLIGVSVSEQQAANVAFREGNLQLNDGLFVAAVAKYQEALKHWDHPGIHYNLALALLNLERPIEVYEHLNKAVQYGPEPLEKDKYEHAKEYLKLVSGQLADVEVSCDKIGAKVSVDGKEVFVAPGKYSEKVRIGKHTFVAEKEGYNARVTAPLIGPGEHFRIELKLYTAEELTRYHRKWEDNTWFPYVVGGAGVVVGLAAGGLELAAQSNFNDFNSKVAACNQPGKGCPINTPGIASLRDSGNTKRTLGFVGYSVAGAAIAASGVLLYINRRQPYTITPEQITEPESAGSIAIAPVVSPELTGAMVQGHF